ncbi:MAG TPA: 4-alpha-glucanotransferase [Gemmatimonadaceae bacterium]|jgi:4-alpha-glucanotransferase
MGIDASTDARAGDALRQLDDRDQRRIFAAVRVVLADEAWESTLRFRIPAEFGPPNASKHVEYECTLRDEHGENTTYAGGLRRTPGDLVDVGLAPLIGAGYYDAHLTLQVRGARREAEQLLILAPPACVTPTTPAFGIVANLYTVRSATNWSVGNLGDLARLAEWSAAHGASFVGINPLHALRNTGHDISPYSPVSRLFRSPAYLDIEAIPELAASDAARALLSSTAVRAELADLRAGTRVEYERATSLARPILEALHSTFRTHHDAADDPRRAAYERYVTREGDALTAHATFCALDEHFAPAASWREWPAAYRVPSSPAVAEFRAAHRERVDFHRWLQFVLDDQLAHAAQRGRDAGLSMGIYQDLAIGSAPNGSDAWAYQHLFASGVTVGAPPDPLAPQGQNWGMPPISPHRLHDDRYAYWIALLRASLRHGGALRIDHVLGLFRQFWIPEGRPVHEGAYVRVPTNDLLGILALESARHRAIIVGEDLGTVPPEVPPMLRAWGIHGSRVLLFERARKGSFRRAAAYEPLSLATANTHDLPPLAGFWRGRDLELRHEHGLIATPTEYARARAARASARRALFRRLVTDGALDAQRDPVALTGAELCAAVHRFLCATPANLVGLSLDDLTGETEPVNLPGVPPDEYPSWTRRMRVPLESLNTDPGVGAALECKRGAGR